MNKYEYNNTECEEDDADSWLVTYADTITLLMTFFVLLLSVSVVDQAKFEEQVEAIHKGGFSSKGHKAFPFDELKKELDKVVESKDLKKEVKVTRTPKGITIELASKILYKSGSAELKNEAIPALTEVAKAIEEFKYDNYKIEVEGHTDDVPIHTVKYPSNWELSVHRATNVIKFFAKNKIPQDHMKAAGYSDTKPKVPNKDANNKPIKENRAKNRRVVIHIER